MKNDDKIRHAVLNDAQLDRGQIMAFLKTDLERVGVFVGEILANPTMLDAMTDVMYKRYVELHQKESAQGGLFEGGRNSNGDVR